MASRAFRAAVIGLGFVPASFYAAWLIGRLVFSSAELSDKASRRMWGAFALTFATFLFWWVLIRAPF
ncbi:MAG TPA: hypothetical protein VGM05_13860 [Planctomycetaceae bacterium]|jgi:hypothetical protein